MTTGSANSLVDRLDPAHAGDAPLRVARIDEARCIGCTLCREACPVDAIVGAGKRMHTILPVLCTGCELCIPPCPVDCIALVPAGRAWSAEDARAAQARFDALALRRRVRAEERAAAATGGTASSEGADRERAFRQKAVASALVRARARRAAAAARKASS